MTQQEIVGCVTNEDRSSVEVVALCEDAGVKKITAPWQRTLVLSTMAGAFIALGAHFSLVVATGAGEVWYGGVQVLKGIAFSMGLGLVIAGGAELFTGSVLHVMALASRRVNMRAMVRNWGIVFFGNALGAVGIALLLLVANVHTNAGGELGAIALKVATAKVELPPLEAFARGILCNIMVCIAIWVALTTRTIGGKTAAFTLPIAMFVASGFEHVVANLFFLPYALLITVYDPSFFNSISALPGTFSTFDVISNIFFVGLGNVVGGGLFVGMAYWLLYRRLA